MKTFKMPSDATMQGIHDRITAAVERSVAKGIERKEAFTRHVRYLREEFNPVYKAYCIWLLGR